MSKYTLKDYLYKILLFKNKEAIAMFDKKHRQDAQKVCDLLNETSRSQGKYPK